MGFACACHRFVRTQNRILLAAEVAVRGLSAECKPALLPQVQGLEDRVLLSAYNQTQFGPFGVNQTGANPISSLTSDASGNLYGTTSEGGPGGAGTVFEIAAGSNALTTIAWFNGANGAEPHGGVTFDAFGNLFGTTSVGGTNNDGTVFEIAKGSNAITTLASFNGYNGVGPQAGVTFDSSGNLYGTTSFGGAYDDGEIFEIPSGSTSLTVLASISWTTGEDINGGVAIDASGNLYGTAQFDGPGFDGSVFEVARGTDTFTTIASFDQSNGAFPIGGVALDSSGNIYGTTSNGGPAKSGSAGTVFEIASGSTTITTRASFNSNASPMAGVTVDASGNLFGTTGYGGTVFEVGAGSMTATTLASFNTNNESSILKAALMLDASGNIYGTTSTGGTVGMGTVFEIPKSTGTPLTIVSFQGTNGSFLQSGLALDSAGDLYGVAAEGGTFGEGAVYEIPDGSDAVVSLASFDGTNGSDPTGTPIVDASGNLYGTTGSGGASGTGTVFEIASGSNAITTLASFPASGGDPSGNLIFDGSGDLLGTTLFGGAYGTGTVFEIGKGSNSVTTLASFDMTSNQLAATDLTLDGSGNLYGTTFSGGIDGDGTVFEIASGSTTVTTLAAFNGTDGQSPVGGVVRDAAGNLYGTTQQGGPNNDGVIFELPNGSNVLTTLAAFDTVNSDPTRLSMDLAGNLFGATAGEVFELMKGSNSFTSLNDGGAYWGVTLDAFGNLYGTFATGGPGGAGNVFELAANSAITLAPSADPNPSNATTPLTLTATVSGGVPDGETVTLIDTSNNDSIVGTGTLSSGSAMLTITACTLSAGTHKLIAIYGGDANFAASESAPYTQTILPDITGISPSSGPAAGGTTVTIIGGGFTGATTVDFGSTPATSFTVNAAGTQITAVEPAGIARTTVDVTVVTSGGTTATSAADQFTYLPAWLAVGSAATWNAATDTLTVTGSATITADPGSDEPNILASGSSAIVTVDPTASPSDIHIGGMTLTNGASIVMSDVDMAQVAKGTNAANHHSDHNVLVIGTLGAVNDPTISIDSASKLDLGDNDLIVHTGSSDAGTDDVQGFPETNELKAIEALAAEGRNIAPGGVYDGTWTGNGLTSSAAATADSGAYAGYEQNILAVEQNSDMYLGGYTKWKVGSASETLGANDIIVKYTYNGDLNLDGAVDGNAATIFSTFYDNGATSGNVYAYGDLNGDGKINGNDATIFSTVYGNGLDGSGLPLL